VTKGYIRNCGPLNALCQEANFYQLYSREYVQELGDYLLKRTASRLVAGETQRRNQQQNVEKDDDGIFEDTPSMSPETVVLDIGAGDGLLMHCLRDYMERKVMGLPLSDNRKGNKRRNNRRNVKNNTKHHTSTIIPTMAATDDMSWKIFAKAEVEKLAVEQALEKYTRSTNALPKDPNTNKTPEQQMSHPQVIVLCSWMPMGQDWTSHFRAAGVDEYILIGEADDGSCGENWQTWGNPAFCDRDGEDSAARGGDGPIPPYAAEGYQRTDMDALAKYQFSSFDLANSKSSKTVSFRRKPRKK